MYAIKKKKTTKYNQMPIKYQQNIFFRPTKKSSLQVSVNVTSSRHCDFYAVHGFVAFYRKTIHDFDRIRRPCTSYIFCELPLDNLFVSLCSNVRFNDVRYIRELVSSWFTVTIIRDNFILVDPLFGEAIISKKK